jgi:lysyl-tRNA synthetase class 2
MTSPAPPWQPACPIDALKSRAALLAYVRDFFRARGVLEVETPVLARHGVTDRNIEGIVARWPLPGRGRPRQGWLQTSPEYHMKRLLAAGSGSIYQVFRAFRGHESGRRHNPEFSLLEWYRIGFDHHHLMDEVADLVCGYLGCLVPVRVSYQELFEQYLDIDPFTCSLAQLRERAGREIGLEGADLGRDEILDALVSLAIEPRLRQAVPTFVYGFPPSQAALARLECKDGLLQAHRFELYVQGVELCNGYWELADVQEQGRRFAEDNRERAAAGQAEREADPFLLAALEAGLPECAGVALGLDRLLMLHEGAGRLDDVIAFPIDRA